MGDAPGCLLTLVDEELTLADLTATGERLEALLRYVVLSDFCDAPAPALADVPEPHEFVSGHVRVEHLAASPLRLFLTAVPAVLPALPGVSGVAAAALRALPALVRRHRQMTVAQPLLTQEWLARHLRGETGGAAAADLSTVDGLLASVERAVFHPDGWGPPT